MNESYLILLQHHITVSAENDIKVFPTKAAGIAECRLTD